MALIIDNEPRAYEWGAPGAIGRLRGIVSRAFHTGTSADGVFSATDADAPEAELWLGTHPSWPSIVSEGPHAGQTLPEALREEGWPEDIGFLLKLLAIEKPLSLQVHPSVKQAQAGFERENAAGVPLDAPHRNFRDPNAKPEMVFVLSERFELCAGFRAPEEVIADVRKLGQLSSPGQQPFWEEFLQQLSANDSIETAMRWLLANDGAAASRGSRLMVSVLESRDSVLDAPRDRLLRRLVECYGTDLGLVVSLLLRHETLLQGQALYLQPRTPHFYISGIAVELMGPSDNVLRGGLTHKHVDVQELLSTLDYEASAPRHLFEYHKGQMTVFHAAGAGLRLAFAHGRQGEQISVPFQPGDIAYVLGGKLQMSDGQREETVHTGQAVALVRAGEVLYTAPESGSGMLLVAGKTPASGGTA